MQADGDVASQHRSYSPPNLNNSEEGRMCIFLTPILLHRLHHPQSLELCIMPAKLRNLIQQDLTTSTPPSELIETAKEVTFSLLSPSPAHLTISSSSQFCDQTHKFCSNLLHRYLLRCRPVVRYLDVICIPINYCHLQFLGYFIVQKLVGVGGLECGPGYLLDCKSTRVLVDAGFSRTLVAPLPLNVTSFLLPSLSMPVWEMCPSTFHFFHQLNRLISMHHDSSHPSHTLLIGKYGDGKRELARAAISSAGT